MAQSSKKQFTANDGSIFTFEDLIQIQGLENAAHYNGKLAMVINFLPEKQRFVVSGIMHQKKYKNCSIKAENMIRYVPKKGMKKRIHECAEFWPSNNSTVVSDIKNWPSDWTEEITFLKNQRNWKEPKVATGIYTQTANKADFVMYFDADETQAPVNRLGNQILSLLPSFEMAKLGGSVSEIRGRIILIHSPTNSMDGSNFMDVPSGKTTWGNPNEKFSLQQMKDLGDYLCSNEARRRANEIEDNPMTRFFGF